ncbi:winged helix-turn-helix domain-containing protein [Effusibacillus consociatus]|uniref:Winged helix-turn-helix domain-containing protein n=1 Tax=Effusibacillus consociatus TaxID=1117041 RepID=A0ABV9Q0R8_9BACL
MNFKKDDQIVIKSGLYLDLTQELLVNNNFPISLSRIEFRLLRCLALNMGSIVPNQVLIEGAWGKKFNCIKQSITRTYSSNTKTF